MMLSAPWVAGWRTKIKNFSTMAYGLWRITGPSAFFLSKGTLLKSDKISCSYSVVNCIRLRTFWTPLVLCVRRWSVYIPVFNNGRATGNTKKEVLNKRGKKLQRNRPMSMRHCEIVQYPLSQSGTQGDIYRGKDLWKRNVLSVEWKSDGVMDGESGDDEWDEVTCERSESGRDRWGRGWQHEWHKSQGISSG